jgi:hypothetical protein
MMNGELHLVRIKVKVEVFNICGSKYFPGSSSSLTQDMSRGRKYAKSDATRNQSDGCWKQE